jgi:hypothetical protein
MTPPVGALVAAAQSGDAELCAWIAERLRPLAGQPIAIRLTVHAGGGKITVKRDPPVFEGNGVKAST